MGQKIAKSTTIRSYYLIKDQKAAGLEIAAPKKKLLRLRPMKQLLFEKELFPIFNKGLLKSSMTFKMVHLLTLKLQRSESYKSDETVAGLNFSYKWWKTYQQRYGIKYARRQGNQTYYPEQDIETERTRILREL